MAPHNEMIVRRSFGLLDYGPTFQYQELFACANTFTAILTSLTIYFVFIALALIKPLQYLLGRFGPSPGEGPSVEQ